MPQNPFGDNKVLGVVYNTSMTRPDAALALSALWGFDAKRESRVGAICVVGAGLNTAIFCDMVGRTYTLGAARNSNSVLPVGLADASPMPPDASMIRTAVERKNEKNELQYTSAIQRVAIPLWPRPCCATESSSMPRQ